MLKLKRRITVFIVASFIVAFWVGVTQAVEVTFEDSYLEDEVRYYLDKPTGIITDTDMATLSTFSAVGYGISSIQGLEYATNLTELELEDNYISDLSPLSDLTNLTHLYLGFNEIGDISPLARLTNLTHLELYHNEISDTYSLSCLTNLTHLDLNANQIGMLDFSGSDFSSLEYFDIGVNPVHGAFLANATLTQSTFNVLMKNESAYNCGIAEMPGVVDLILSDVDFSDISNFSEMYTMDDLESLDLTDSGNLSGNEVITWLDQLDSLNRLSVIGLWNSFDESTKNSLLAWDAIDGNELSTVRIYPGDANRDGRIDGSDVTILAGNWQHGVGAANPDATWEMGDFNGDGKVDGSDVTILAGWWQIGVTSAATAVPEPATLSMLMLLILAALAVPRRRRN